MNRILITLSLLMLASQLVLISSNYPGFPERIPIHISPNGEIDQWGVKWLIWLLPMINAIILLALSYFVNRPEILNYPGPVTEKNKRSAYKSMQQFLLIVGLVVSLILLLIVLYIINYLSGEIKVGLTGMVVLLLLLSLSPLFLIVQMQRTPPQ